MCLNPLFVKNRRLNFDSRFDKFMLTVPCNHCKECVDNRAYDMEIRLVSEYQRLIDHSGCAFNYTLTYNDDFLPTYLGIPVLCRRDIQLWKKRLKKRLADDGRFVHIFYAGEYGHIHDRPHWHVILFCDKCFDPSQMYKDVVETWDIKAVSDGNRPSFVGLPAPCKDGRYIRNNDPANAVIRGVNALRYCAKYCFKSYSYANYIRQRLLAFAHDNFDSYFHDEKSFNKFLETYEFPDDSRFSFSLVRDRTLDYLVNFFSKCFRCPDGLGMAQQSYLDADYISKTSVSDGFGNYMQYPISRYLRNKLFNISCILYQNSNYSRDVKRLKEFCPDKKTFARYQSTIINDVKITQHTKKWLDYQKKTVYYRAQSFQDYYLCNKDFELNQDYIPDNLPKFRYVKDYLSYLYNYLHCSLRDYYLYNFVYKSSWLCRFSVANALGFVQCRNKFIPLIYDVRLDDLNRVIKVYHPILTSIKQQLKYAMYLQNIDKYNKRQELLSTINNTPLRKLSIMPFHIFINHKKMTSQDVQTYY